MPVSQLDQYSRQLLEIDEDAQELTAGLDEARFNWRPSPNQWSIEECIGHLTMVAQWEVQAIEQAIVRGKERGLTGSGPFEYGPVGRFLIHQSGPPVRTPLPAPARFVPLHGQPLTAVMPTFFHVQSQLRSLLERSEGLDLRRVKVSTPISRFLRVSLGVMFAQIVAHERRHLAQARRVRENLPV